MTRAEHIAKIEAEGFRKNTRWENDKFFRDREYVWLHKDGKLEWHIFSKLHARLVEWVEDSNGVTIKELKAVHFKETP